MNPIKYLEIHSPEIIEECEDLKLENKGNLIIEEIKSLITDLTQIRISQKKTINRCREYMKIYEYKPSNGNSNIALPTSNVFDYQSFIFTKWVISALKEDDSYTYGYNCMVQFFNRNSEILPIAIKTEITVAKLLAFGSDNEKTKSSIIYYFIDKKRGENLMPFLIERYKDKKPMSIALMVFALIELKIIQNDILENQTNLHHLLEHDFGKIGTRTSLQTNITKFHNSANSVDRHSRQANFLNSLIFSRHDYF